MGGKKKAGGKGKAKKGDAGDGDLDPKEAAQLLAIQVNSLKQKLVLQQQRADMSKASQNQLRNRVMGLDKMMDDEKSQTWKITCQMTRQFKSMQQELISKINKLTDQNTQLKQQICSFQNQCRTVQRKDQTIKKLEAEKEQQLATKDAQISTLKKNIQEMSSKFTDMLKQTLQKMQERIELANNQWENQNDSTNLKRIQEIAQVNK